MSIADLRDLAAKLNDHRERQLGYEPRLIADALLQCLHEIADLDRRVAALEGKPQSN